MSTIFTKIGNNNLMSLRRKKLKPIKSENMIKINKTLSMSTKNQTNRLMRRNLSQGELSVLLFQGNEVDLVRSINPDLDRDICANILLKEQLKNNIINYDKYDLRTAKNNISSSLPKIKKITIHGILESEKKLNQNKKEAQKNLAYSQLELELYTELKTLRKEYNDKKEEKNNIYKKLKEASDKIEEMNLELQVLNSNSYIDRKGPKSHSRDDRTGSQKNVMMISNNRLPKIAGAMEFDKAEESKE